MKKTLIGLAVFSLLSCEKTAYSPDPVEDTHELTSIAYSIEDGDGVRIFVQPLHSLNYNNRTSVSQQVIVDPLAGVLESSQFSSEDEKAFSLVDAETTKVPVPVMLNDGVAVVGKAKWAYGSELIELNPELNYRDTIDVPANTLLTVTMSVHLNEYQLTYKAQFEGKPSGTLTEVKGKWKGVTVADVDKQIVYQ